MVGALMNGKIDTLPKAPDGRVYRKPTFVKGPVLSDITANIVISGAAPAPG